MSPTHAHIHTTHITLHLSFYLKLYNVIVIFIIIPLKYKMKSKTNHENNPKQVFVSLTGPYDVKLKSQGQRGKKKSKWVVL